MNALPRSYTALVEAKALNSVILLDGAMQQRLGERLARDPDGAVSLFADYSRAAQSLGPWLMIPERAATLGIDGCARGVNWLASALPMDAVREHLLHWMRSPDPTVRAWLRLADGRALTALMGVWRHSQRTAFCQPWQAWCFGDRNGMGRLLALPDKLEILTPVSTALDAAQQQRVHLATTADRLIHELKTTVALHASIKGCRETRHATVQGVLSQAAAAGYAVENDLGQFVVWALRTGATAAQRCAGLTAVELQLTGAALAKSLGEDMGPEKATP
ncbi:DUF4123 domain-containing protein [Pseudomonas sp.]|uniref:DUF4123 domain-containing protein n=1 Tax=Pseudomonas sp. TaxID=306 RepID=UPI002EDA6A8F